MIPESLPPGVEHFLTCHLRSAHKTNANVRCREPNHNRRTKGMRLSTQSPSKKQAVPHDPTGFVCQANPAGRKPARLITMAICPLSNAISRPPPARQQHSGDAQYVSRLLRLCANSESRQTVPRGPGSSPSHAVARSLRKHFRPQGEGDAVEKIGPRRHVTLDISRFA